MKLLIHKGKTSKLQRVFIQDSSKSDGSGLAGLTSASGGLTCYYVREGDSSTTAISLSSGTLGTWSSGGFVEIDATHMPGMYELGLPNAVLASGADSVVVYLKGATNMAPTPLEIQLTDFDPQNGSSLGLGFLTGDAYAQWTSVLTQSYASNGAAFTPAQALFMIWSALAQFQVSGTTIICKKLDGTTTSMQFSMDDSTNPTSRTRSA